MSARPVPKEGAADAHGDRIGLLNLHGGEIDYAEDDFLVAEIREQRRFAI